MTDLFKNHTRGLDCPPSRIFSVTPNDSSDLSVATRAIMVAGDGNVAVETVDGDTGTLPALVAGVPYPIRAVKILATGTTATGIVGLA